jgi:DNA-directed RNA polymerase subunit RPC12/RpoP
MIGAIPAAWSVGSYHDERDRLVYHIRIIWKCSTCGRRNTDKLLRDDLPEGVLLKCKGCHRDFGVVPYRPLEKFNLT